MGTGYYPTRRKPSGKGAKRLAALALCLSPALGAHAATNWVDGVAFGTNYDALATAPAISSQSDGNGSLIVSYEGTTNLVLAHRVKGYVVIDNRAAGFAIDATGGRLEGSQGSVLGIGNATNLVITGGHFIGIEGIDTDLPPIPGQPAPTNTTYAMGGTFYNSVVTLDGSEFAGTNKTEGLSIERTTLVASNATIRGGAEGIGLEAYNHSSVTIHSGTISGGTNHPAIYLQDSDAAIHAGVFSGNAGTTNAMMGSGLFCKLTEAATNKVSLYGGEFGSLAFLGTDGSVVEFLAGTNLVVHDGIEQTGGIVLVDNRNDAAFRNLSIHSGTMDFGSGRYSLPEGGLLAFEIDGTTNGLLRAGTAYLHTNSTLRVSADGLPAGENNMVLLSTDSGLFTVGASSTNPATPADFSTNNLEVTVSGRSRFKTLFVDNGRDLRFQFTTQSLQEYWNATGQMADLADDLEAIGNTDMMAIIDSYDDPAASHDAVEKTYFGAMNTFGISMQGLNAALGQSVARAREFRDQLKLRPSGPQGPPVVNNRLRGWAKYYGQFVNHDAEGLNDEYDATLHGGVVGYDKNVGDHLLLGASGGAGNYRITAGHNAQQEMQAYHGALYGTYGTERAYFDGGIAYGFNQVDTRTDTPFSLKGDFDAQLVTAYFGCGYDLPSPGAHAVFTPEAAIQYTTYSQDAYSEKASAAVPRHFDDFDADSLRSSLGLNVSMLNSKAFETFAFKIDGRLHWMHEFNPDPGKIDFTLDGGSNDYRLSAPSLDEDTFRAGFGFTFFNTLKSQPNNVLLRLDLDELFGDGLNALALSAKVIYAF